VNGGKRRFLTTFGMTEFSEFGGDETGKNCDVLGGKYLFYAFVEKNVGVSREFIVGGEYRDKNGDSFKRIQFYRAVPRRFLLSAETVYV